MYEARYLAGMVAGGMTSSNVIGYVAAFPIAQVVRGINAFALGAQSVNPDVEIAVHWTETWYGPSIEQEQAESLIERGADVLTMHQNSPAVLQVAEEHGKMTIGYHSDMRAFAPTAALTSAVWHWDGLYQLLAEDLLAGSWQSEQIWWGMKEGAVGLAPLSDRVPAALVEEVERQRQAIVAGQLRVFEGPIRDTAGAVQVPSGRLMSDADLLTMDFFVQGVESEIAPNVPTPNGTN